ncbi:putative spermidine/putrescine transport system substrate-binding protein [Rhizobium subbaraonis]|uniref:Putative spermidine/putrescine transport system substrate-binding protein n=1 Tax=Rhizobium subbaraonis TaxID=908946 RepID=A0A285U145_9HYPH|nr:ABC transporter substrate-binding protein [Rhizobium subbaraonis]SOC35680.1 putative spermidine/putrescine transport system substrate-binding protein [Rhizobium subbaraonis]
MMKRLLLASVAGLIGMPQAVLAQSASQSITVAYYGGNWGEAFDACVAQPFSKATGIKVVAEIGNSTTTLSKLQQQTGNAVIDVAYMDGGISEIAEAAGVLAPIDLAQLPHATALQPQAAYKNGGHVFAVSAGYYSLGLIYNTNEVSEAPSSWEELWNDAYAGAVAVPSPNNSAGVPFVIFLAGAFGDASESMDATFAKLKSLDSGLLYDTSGAASNAFQSNEVIIGAHFNVGAWDLIDAGLPIGFTVPKEGVWATDARMHIVKGTKNAEAAAKFIDTALTPEAATCLAEKLYLGPAITGVALSADIERKLPWGSGGSIEDLRLFDWSEVNAKRPAITDRWNREIAN